MLSLLMSCGIFCNNAEVYNDGLAVLWRKKAASVPTQLDFRFNSLLYGGITTAAMGVFTNAKKLSVFVLSNT